MADKFKVVEGEQPIFTSNDEEACNLVATQRKQELLKCGCDIRGKEHKVVVVKNV
jgi:hypothetical protein